MSWKYEWFPVDEADLEDGSHVLYAAKMRDGRLVVAEQLRDGSWDVETECAPGYGYLSSPKVNCKSLTSAKRWVARYL